MSEATIRSERQQQESSGSAAQRVSELDVLLEIEILEERVQEAVRRIAALKEERDALHRDVVQLHGERAEIVERLGRLVEKVDALGGGL